MIALQSIATSMCLYMFTTFTIYIKIYVLMYIPHVIKTYKECHKCPKKVKFIAHTILDLI